MVLGSLSVLLWDCSVSNLFFFISIDNFSFISLLHLNLLQSNFGEYFLDLFALRRRHLTVTILWSELTEWKVLWAAQSMALFFDFFLINMLSSYALVPLVYMILHFWPGFFWNLVQTLINLVECGSSQRSSPFLLFVW